MHDSWALNSLPLYVVNKLGANTAHRLGIPAGHCFLARNSAICMS
ncbi:MAG: hypothetical protein QOE41_841 [Mycobacterium sp.]|nr:hypothetical protein [Mycobacterium sp.]